MDSTRDAQGPVVVETYNQLWEAEHASSRLAAEGIEAEVLDTLSPGLMGVGSLTLGGHRLMVAQADAERARAILAEPPPADPGRIIEQENVGAREVDARGVIDAERCPSCGSDLISWAIQPGWVVAASLVLLGLPLLFIPKKRRCHSCDHQWRP